MVMEQTTGAAFVSKKATAATYGGSSVAVMSGLVSDTVLGLTTSQWSVVGVIGGLVIGLIGVLVNAYFKHQHLLIAQMSAKADPDE